LGLEDRGGKNFLEKVMVSSSPEEAFDCNRYITYGKTCGLIIYNDQAEALNMVLNKQQ
jgi:hypothetical protein